MDEILNLIESVSEGFPSYFCTVNERSSLFAEFFKKKKKKKDLYLIYVDETGIKTF